MILSAQQISEAYRRGDILINPFEESQVQGATYDLRVGDQGITTSTKKLVNIRESGYILLQPGDFGIVIVLEEIRLGPQYAGRFGLRSKYARKGLIATTGPQIDPGYHGRLIVGLTNLTPNPVSLPYKDDFVSVEFHRLEEATTKPYSGQYQDRMSLGPEEIEAVTEGTGMALSEVLTTLGSLSQNVGSLTGTVATLAGEVKTLRWLLPLVTGLGIAVVAALVAIKP
jgi:dCTP deaminase